MSKIITKFTPDFFVNNRKALRDSLPKNMIIILTANGSLQRNGDVTYRFRQESNFWYLTGITKPDTLLVIDKDNEYLIIPQRETTLKQFDGEDDTGNLIEISGVSDVIYEKDGWRKLSDQLKYISAIATLAPMTSYMKRSGIYTNPSQTRLVRRLMRRDKKLRIYDIRQNLVRLRSVKQPDEIKIIQYAIDQTGDALMAVHNKLRSYSTEQEVEADITSMFIANGCTHAFAPIIANGVNACTIHYISNKSNIGKDNLLVMDIGAEIENYAADITRTYAVTKPNKRQLDIFNAVREAQLYALSEIKPGILMKQLEAKVEKFIGKQLQSLGLINVANRNQIRQYYPHAVSHFLGLDVHDVGEYNKPLAPNMIITCEPGIYVPEEGVGVRIEDDVLITDNGNQILSKKIPIEL